MTCEQCELNKRRAQLWRHEAYKLAGYPLDWEPELTIRREWVGLTDEEVRNLWEFPPDQSWIESVHTAIRRAEAALKEKNA